jgi:hypothetical protein
VTLPKQRQAAAKNDTSYYEAACQLSRYVTLDTLNRFMIIGKTAITDAEYKLITH